MSLQILPGIEEVADRIARAYLRRRPEWRGVGVPARVWADAAAALIELHRSDPAMPLDPELYVAAQPPAVPLADPWVELTRAASARRYRCRVRQIVRSLRRELRDELRRAEQRLDRGADLEAILFGHDRSLSALGRYIVAHRAHRPDLAERLRAAAQEQHRACPLYRSACRGLLAPGSYPVVDLLPGVEARRRPVGVAPSFSVN
jgi:hypothetical protein